MPLENPSTNPKPPRSEAQIAASRANGSKSNGPVSIEGKSTVSTNRMTHGFRATGITLAKEDASCYNNHLDAYITRYNPTDKVESDLVGLLASSMWQVMRSNSIEVALFDLEIAGLNKKELEDQFDHMDDYGRLALAFKNTHKEHSIELLRRYKATAERAFHRALQAIEQICKNRDTGGPPRQTPQPESTVQTQEAPAQKTVSQEAVDKPDPTSPAITAPPHPFLVKQPLSNPDPNTETGLPPIEHPHTILLTEENEIHS